MTPQGGPSEVEKFLSKFCKLTIYSESILGPHHEKRKLEKISTFEKNYPPPSVDAIHNLLLLFRIFAMGVVFVFRIISNLLIFLSQRHCDIVL